MAGSTHDVIAALNDLLETCRDSEAGFRHAGRHVSDRETRALFGDYARRSAELAAELEAEVRRLGGEPGEHSVFDGLAHPGWITIARKLTGEDESAVMAECDCGVDALERSYAGALERELPGAVRSLVERQHRQVREVSDRVHALAGRHPFGVRPSSPGQKRGTDRARTKNRPAAGPGKRARGELREPDALGPATPQG
jgi:uncharacterized protein (TIGR02284 family)